MKSEKLLSFRGQISSDDNARTVDQLIFTYTSPDLTRAWKIESFYLWPKTVRAITGTGDGQFQMSASLATDEIGSVGFAEIMSVIDNRQIGWISKGYNLRDSSDDFITSPTGLVDNQAIMDPDHIVNRNLYINLYTTSDNTASPEREYNYLLILKEVKVSESEAILQMVKGVAQDIRN
jgi:hypothetical protein